VKDLKNQLVSALLVVLTAAGLISAGINFQKNRGFQLAEDGVTWVDRFDAYKKPIVLALMVERSSGAAKAGIREGDILLRVNGAAIGNAIDSTRILARVTPWGNAEYVVQRDGVEVTTKVIVSERKMDAPRFYQYFIGLAYLAIGLFVYFRRQGAPKAIHFYCLCLASFVLSTFHYTGRLNNFDKAMYWGNVVAGVLAPTLFLHFTLVFPEPRRWMRSLWVSAALYVPAAIMVAIYVGASSTMLRVAIPLLELRWLIDRVWMAFLSVTYLMGALAATLQARRQDDPVMRQQVKWLRNGALAGVLPFTLLYTIPYVMGAVPTPLMNLAVLSLTLVPVTWAYAILRYRLMDVDVIFQQGFAYTLATLAVLGIFYALILSVRPVEEIDPGAMVLLIVIAAFVFQPIRNWVQEVLDRYVFYKDRYDYRRTLVEFARELSSETDVDQMLQSVADRIRRTLYIPKVAVFMGEDASDGYRLKLYASDVNAMTPVDRLDLSFLPQHSEEPIFFERTRVTLDVVSQHLSESVRSTIARLDLTYYVPCHLRGKTIAYLGVSRTDKGDFLSSEDLELLTTLSGYVGIAIENSRLYRSLERKAAEYERLKEFSENIVESINVGIVAADLEDRVESWNSQMEALTGISREQATGQRLVNLFPLRLTADLSELRGETGIHQLYKIPMASNGSGAAQREVLVNIAVAPLFTRDQERIGRLIIFDDVTERANLEQKLVQADKLSSIGLLAAGVAHEVNTPLAVISTYAQMLSKQMQGDDSKSKILEKIAKQTFRASEIVNSLLNFSRTSKAEMEDLDLNRVIRETVQLIEPQLIHAGVSVELRQEPNPPPVRANSNKMQQVFLNLFLNARDAMETGGRLIVTTRTDGDSLKIDVADTGKGIPQEDLPRIFDPFFTTKVAKKGTGLGLAVSYGIVREHGGTIDVTSQPGEGTVFHLDLPLANKPVLA
jgi:PAS domain S-box-containing protein